MAGIIQELTTTPEWLDRDFLKTALREGLRRSSLDINTYSFKRATNPGDNYLSQMFRASVNLVNCQESDQDLSVIIKSLPRGDSAIKYCAETKMFEREIEMLSKILPGFNQSLSEIDEPKLSAHLYYKQTDPEEVLVLEDLCRFGFQTLNRRDYLDLEQSKMVAERLALLHAASLVVLQNEPNPNFGLYPPFWNKDNPYFETFLNESLTSMKECLKTWKIFPEILEKFEKIDMNVMRQSLIDATTLKANELHVLNHGDPWTTNVMFKLENQKPTDMRFVDFQGSCFMSPVYDLLFFTATSPKLNIRAEKVDDILETYYNKLNKTCKKLNVLLTMSFNDLKKLYYEKIFFGFFIYIHLLPNMIIESKDVKELSEILDNAEKVNDSSHLKAYFTENFKESAEIMLPYYINHGVLG